MVGRANLVLTKPGTGGAICLAASARAHLVVDTSGTLVLGA